MNRVVIFANGVVQHSAQDDAALHALLDADDVICCADGGVAARKGARERGRGAAAGHSRRGAEPWEDAQKEWTR